jgi:NADP-dependent 3-hydroxy acid dehydrogenase YdfG
MSLTAMICMHSFSLAAASAGIGRATAGAFAAAGAHVALVARGKERLRQLVSELPAGQAVAIPADLAQPEQAAHAVHQAVSDAAK